MNFPGLDPIWSGAHHVGHALGIVRTWSLEECRAGIANGDKLLVVATTALGDSLLTTPLLGTLAHHVGPDRVSLLVKEPYVELYRKDPRVHRVYSVRGKYRWNHLRAKLRADPHRLALLANVTEPDLIPELWHGGVRGFLRYRSRGSRYPKWMANRAMMRRAGDLDYASGHAIENNLAMAEALGLEARTHRLELPQFFADTKARQPTLLIHPGASRAVKRWPVENWARLGDALNAKFDCSMVLTGAADERSLITEIAGRMKSPTKNVAGTLSLVALAEAQAGAVAFLSGDTGPYHLAVAVGCPTVTLFAPTDRGSSLEACGPYQANPNFHRAIQTQNYGDSIASLPFERVLAEASDLVAKLLARKGAA